MKILDVRTRPPFGSIRDGMFNNPGRELFEPEAFAPRYRGGDQFDRGRVPGVN